MDAETRYWIDKLNEDNRALRDQKFYELPHGQHSIEQLYTLRETIESHMIHADMLVGHLESLKSGKVQTFLKKIFKK